MGSCLPCRADNNPSDTRTRFLPGLKNSRDKLSVLLGSTLHQKAEEEEGQLHLLASPHLFGHVLSSKCCVQRSPRQFFARMTAGITVDDERLYPTSIQRCPTGRLGFSFLYVILTQKAEYNQPLPLYRY